MTTPSVHFSSATDSWSTPAALFRELDKEFNFNFDPCPLDLDPNRSGKQLDLLADNSVPQVEKIDGLDAEWGTSTFCNPPYSQLYDWLKKGFQEWKKGKTVVFLIPSRTARNARLPLSGWI